MFLKFFFSLISVLILSIVLLSSGCNDVFNVRFFFSVCILLIFLKGMVVIFEKILK